MYLGLFDYDVLGFEWMGEARDEERQRSGLEENTSAHWYPSAHCCS